MKFIPRIAPSTARSRSASGKTTIGFFPPSSSVTVFTLAAAALAWMRRPVAALPMKAIRGMPGCLTSASPTSAPSPVRICTTPGGNSRCRSSPIASADSGVNSDGLRITQLPAASGAASLVAANISGWLKAMIRATTPNGSRTV